MVRWIGTGSVLVAALLVSRGASAQRIGLGVSAGGQWMRSAPPVSISPDESNLIRFPDGSTGRLDVPLGFVGAAAFMNVHLSRNLYLPTLGIGYWGVVGPAPRVVASVDGSFVEVRSWRASIVEASVLGIGWQAPIKRWLLSADIAAGFAFFSVPGSVAAGNVIEETTATAFSPTVRVDLSGCRRFDPWTRMCLVLTPNVYSFGFFNGGTLTLRWEIGS